MAVSLTIFNFIPTAAREARRAPILYFKNIFAPVNGGISYVNHRKVVCGETEIKKYQYQNPKIVRAIVTKDANA